MKKKILPILSFIAVGYSAISVGYTALPIEYQNMIPQFNNMVAWVTGGSSGIVGATLLYVSDKLKKSEQVNDTKVNAAIEKTLELVGAYKEVKGELKELKGAYVDLTQELKHVRKLNEVALNVKLDNKLLGDASRKMIEGVLSEE